ncbi:MAG: hypothetical protein H7070_02335 [Saprospiraceae bacterium]|nr:hypothetical protein [Pyrinomonadaceae bacterium]
MKTKIFTVALLIGASLQVAVAQKTADLNNIREDIKSARQEARLDKSIFAKQFAGSKSAGDTVPNFYDEDSFGKNARFLGGFYAGTLIVYSSCDPVVLADAQIVLAADDKCVAHTTAAPMATATVSDPLWQITIPGRTVDNVIYPILNNGVGYDAFSPTGQAVGFFYSPRVTIESEALNDPLAIDPNTGLPMNGSFTTSLAGSVNKRVPLAANDFGFDYTNNASVSSRGLSRDYFAAIGLPTSVINKLFKKDMTLKFAIRARVTGPVDYAQFFYTFRLLGN